MSGTRRGWKLAVFVAATGWCGVALAQVSPGPLARPHGALEGATQCFRCHAQGAGKAGMDRRCLDCHQEVDWMRKRQRGFHARVAASACASCHPDHGGRDFALIAWDGGSKDRFDHSRAGFALLGRHAELACAQCHKPALQKSPVVPLLKLRDRARSWLGLEPACASCHADPHRGSLGAACASCHSQSRWSPAPGFEHARTAYPLTGAHARPACLACHATPAVNEGRDASGALRPRWRPVPHADCVSCHRDPHAGRFTGTCARCHGTASWTTVNAKGFDHDQTRYPLRGAHATVRCDDCHAASRGGKRPPHARCADCHADAHRGAATLHSVSVDCATCHAVQGFTPSTLPRTEHQRTAYPLEGAHQATECRDCHTRAPAGSAEAATLGRSRVRLRPGHARCVDCHRDPHAGRFSSGGKRARTLECLACHTLMGFQPSGFDGRAHATSAFPLEGAHLAVPCQRCHEELSSPAGGSLRGGATGRTLSFQHRARACADCHDDPHAGQFRARADRAACEQCHDLATFAPAARFDHDRDSGFALQGAHARTPCAACHRPGPAGRDGKRVVTYRSTPSRCESCHTTGDARGMRDARLLLPSHTRG